MCDNLTWSSCGKHNWGNRTCVYVYAYADDSITTGHLDADTFTFTATDGTGQATVLDLAFGCGLFNNEISTSNEIGIAGFGRGALSLPSQLKVDNFSHCFTAITGLGTGGTIIDSGTGMTTLPQDAYKLMHDAFTAQVRLPVDNATSSSLSQLCFSVPR
ncbi:unnamed protein product [Miscanthus lutarioriparius]|uniref:Peptidase A1 domain-containing protein n=1 Tax=Miscanthus lutarioriparius TaxID=422564 RepID=A0A811SJT2_9POAL|nr:unnamed protein product [Miscanthus lutarioriparius]